MFLGSLGGGALRLTARVGTLRCWWHPSTALMAGFRKPCPSQFLLRGPGCWFVEGRRRRRTAGPSTADADSRANRHSPLRMTRVERAREKTAVAPLGRVIPVRALPRTYVRGCIISLLRSCLCGAHLTVKNRSCALPTSRKSGEKWGTRLPYQLLAKTARSGF
jgi:hypothetical protein